MIRIKPDAPRRVTKLSPSVTKSVGRPQVYASDAARQKAYRARKKAATNG